MINKISAEFDSIDSAEIAARTIKNTVSNVAKISITGKNQFALTETSNRRAYMNVGFAAGATGVFFPAPEMLDVQDTTYYSNPFSYGETVELGHEANIEIMCDSEVSDMVIKKIVGLGGLRVKKA